MREKLYILGYTLAVTAVFGLVVSSVNAALSERAARNRRVAEQRVLLRLAGVKGERLDALGLEETDALFEKTLEEARATTPGGRTIVYYRTTGPGERLLVPVSGSGFWDRIAGYVALDPSAKTIAGIDFTEQSETPGLGARIEEPDFRAQFVGLPYDAPDAEGRRVAIVAHAEKANEVDAITGATETSRKLENLLNASLDRFLEATRGAAASPPAPGAKEGDA